MGILYLVATPIGNLEDVSLRALRILGEVGLIAAEDTRRTKVLLHRYEIGTPLTSYFEHNKFAKLDYLLTQLHQHDIALVSEAGMPAISDPGYELVKAAVATGYTVVPIPGPSALIAALAASGLPTDQFTFAGFLPRRDSERQRFLRELCTEHRTIVAYEAPHRLLATLRMLLETFGDRQIAIARELSKVHEEIIRGSVGQVLLHFSEQAPRGEFTLVVAGASKELPEKLSGEDLDRRLSLLLAEGLTPRRAAAVLAKETGVPVRDLYRRHIDRSR